jgi:hypothetical protein
MKDSLYICIGENYKNNCKLGFCGDVHLLSKWLEILYPGLDAVTYFSGDTNAFVIKYIYENKGKRLEKYKY